jgi:putative DNA primase/helicase
VTGHYANAVELHSLGITALPFLEDGSKSPAVPWRAFQDAPASSDQIDRWWNGNSLDGIGVICGAPSGELLMVEVEGREMSINYEILSEIDDLMAARGLANVWRAVQDGWTEMSPSGESTGSSASQTDRPVAIRSCPATGTGL